MQHEEELLAHLVMLEESLHSPAVRKSSDRLQCLLHPDFKEVSRSGVFLQKEDVFTAFERAASLPTIHSEKYRLVYATDDAAIITYATSYLSELGIPFGHALRSSVWVRMNNHWKLIFHQGTPSEPAKEQA